MNTIKIALAAALVVAAGSSAFAGLYAADPQFVSTQSLTNSYGGDGNQVVAPQGTFDPTYGVNDAERITIQKNGLKDYNK